MGLDSLLQETISITMSPAFLLLCLCVMSSSLAAELGKPKVKVELFNKMDKSGNGLVDENEFLEVFPQKEEAKALFQKSDKNKNKELCPFEWGDLIAQFPHFPEGAPGSS